MLPVAFALMFLGLPGGVLHDGHRGAVRPRRVRRQGRLPVHREDRRHLVELRARRGAAVRLHGLDARALGHRQPAVRGDPHLDAPAAGRPRARHGDHVHPVRRVVGRDRRDRVGRRPAHDPDHAALRVRQGTDLRRDLRRRLARHDHSAVGRRGRHRAAGRRFGRRHSLRHELSRPADGRAVPHLHLRALRPRSDDRARASRRRRTTRASRRSCGSARATWCRRCC